MNVKLKFAIAVVAAICCGANSAAASVTAYASNAALASAVHGVAIFIHA